MFTLIMDLDPKEYRRKTRNSTLIIMAIFIVIGLIMARLSLHFLGPYNNNTFVLNMIGAVFGLFLTFWVVKLFFVNSDWMKEAIYAWQLKRSLMKINNRLRPLQTAEQNDDPIAMQVLRFYHLGLQQMNCLEDNSHANIELQAEMTELADKMVRFELDLNQIQFDDQVLEQFPLTTS